LLPEVREADPLTSCVVQAHYPDWGEAVTDSEYQSALTIAKYVVAWGEKIILEN
jgi:hypothetical protein